MTVQEARALRFRRRTPLLGVSKVGPGRMMGAGSDGDESTGLYPHKLSYPKGHSALTVSTVSTKETKFGQNPGSATL